MWNLHLLEAKSIFAYRVELKDGLTIGLENYKIKFRTVQMHIRNILLIMLPGKF